MRGSLGPRSGAVEGSSRVAGEHSCRAEWDGCDRETIAASRRGARPARRGSMDVVDWTMRTSPQGGRQQLDAAARSMGQSVEKWGRMLNRHRDVSFAKALLAGLVQRKGFCLPESVGEDSVFCFLSFQDAIRVRLVCTQLQRWADSCLARRRLLDLDQLSGPHFVEKGLDFVLGRSTAIKHLVISHSELGNLKPETAQLLSGLKVIRIHRCFGAELHTCIRTLLMHCSNLVEVDCDAMSDETLRALSTHSASTIRVLSCCGSGSKVTGAEIVAFAAVCTKLKELNLAGCAIGDSHLRQLAMLPSVQYFLEKLDVSHCGDVLNYNGVRQSHLTEDGVADSLEHFYALNQLACSGISAEGAIFHALESYRGPRKSKPPLRVIALGDCPLLRNGSLLQSVFKACGISLVSIEMTGCKEISDVAGFCSLAESCPNLESVCLSGCQGVTDLFLFYLAREGSPLHSLTLRRCIRVTDVGLRTIAKHCGALKLLDLSGCTLITDSGIASLFAGAPYLQSLKLYCCSAISDEGFLGAITANERALRDLEELDLSWCFRVLPATLIAMVKQTKSLRRIWLEGFEHLTEHDVVLLKSYRSCLKVFIAHSHENTTDQWWDDYFANRSKTLRRRLSSVDSEHNLNLQVSPQSIVQNVAVGNERNSPSASASSPRLLRRSSSRKFILHQPAGVSCATRRRAISASSRGETTPEDVALDSPKAQPRPSPSQSGRMSQARHLSLDDLARLEESMASVHFIEPSKQANGMKGQTFFEVPQQPSSPLAFHSRRFGDVSDDIERIAAFSTN